MEDSSCLWSERETKRIHVLSVQGYESFFFAEGVALSMLLLVAVESGLPNIDTHLWSSASRVIVCRSVIAANIFLSM